MSADQQGGALKPVTPARVADELRKLSAQRKDGTLEADEYEHRFSRMITELRDLFPTSRIVGWKYELTGSRADVLAAAIRQLNERRSDGCVMNGAAYGAGFGFLEPYKKPVHLPDKHALCAHLALWLKAQV